MPEQNNYTLHDLYLMFNVREGEEATAEQLVDIFMAAPHNVRLQLAHKALGLAHVAQRCHMRHVGPLYEY